MTLYYPIGGNTNVVARPIVCQACAPDCANLSLRILCKKHLIESMRKNVSTWTRYASEEAARIQLAEELPE